MDWATEEKFFEYFDRLVVAVEKIAVDVRRLADAEETGVEAEIAAIEFEKGEADPTWNAARTMREAEEYARKARGEE